MRFPLRSYDRTLDMGSLFPTVDVTTGVDVLARPGQRTLVPDFLDQGYVNLLDGVRAWTTSTFSGQKWGTMCYQHQGTTGLQNFNLAFNGLSAPWQLEWGMQVRFPLVVEVRRLLSLQRQRSGVGSTVRL